MQPRFLLDENVRYDLFVFLKSKGYDVKFPPKGTTDSVVADISKNEDRILITNDKDFEFVSRPEIFSVVLLKIPQADKNGLIKSFDRLISKNIKFESKIVHLSLSSEEVFNLENY